MYRNYSTNRNLKQLYLPIIPKNNKKQGLISGPYHNFIGYNPSSCNAFNASIT